MAQAFGILGFLLALLAILFASEVMRRADQKQTKLEGSLFKAKLNIKALETKLNTLIREQGKQKERQAETLKALAKVKPTPKQPHQGDRSVPADYKTG